MMYEKNGQHMTSIFTSHQSRITALIITFITTLITLSVFFYLSITPSSEFQYNDQDGEFNISHYHDEGNLNIWGTKIPKLQELKVWIGLSDGRDRVAESQNIRGLKDLIEERFPLMDSKPARARNVPALERLADCIETNTCGKGEEKVVILASFHFNNAIAGGTSGEDIWARSTLEAFESLNYTLLYTFSPMDTLTIYQGLGEKVKTIIWEGMELKKCLSRNSTNWESQETYHSSGKFQNTSSPLPGNIEKFGCIKKPGFEIGSIPLEKSFTFHFWGSPENPLGRHFTLSPEDYATWNNGIGNHYLGYSIESHCKSIAIPRKEEKMYRGMVLGKYSDYFNTSSREWQWGKEEKDILYKSIQSIPSLISKDENGKEEEIKFEMIATGGHDDKKTGKHEEMYKGIKNLGSLPQNEWYQTLASSRFLLGVGKPRMSPSPYDALCFGVPFINPISSWNHTDPHDWSVWYTQHDALRPYGPPYVYHVQKENQEQLEEAMQAAIDNPIDRFIPPPMTTESVKQRHRTLVETDWKPWAVAAIEELWTDKDIEFPYLV